MGMFQIIESNKMGMNLRIIAGMAVYDCGHVHLVEETSKMTSSVDLEVSVSGRVDKYEIWSEF